MPQCCIPSSQEFSWLHPCLYIACYYEMVNQGTNLVYSNPLPGMQGTNTLYNQHLLQLNTLSTKMDGS